MKVEKYSTIPEVATFVQTLTGQTPTFTAFAMNWRGVIAPKSEQDLRQIGLRKSDIRLLSNITVEQGTVIHQQFQQSTTRAGTWRPTT